MKLLVILLTTTALHVSANSSAQEITFSGNNISLEKAFKVIKDQTDYSVVCNADLIAKSKTVNVSVSKVPLETFLRLVLKDQQLEYIIENTTIFVSGKANPGNLISIQTVDPSPPLEQPKSLIDVSGRITDENGNGLMGVSIRVRGTKIGVTTNADGYYTLKGVEETALIEISYVGFESRLVSIVALRISKTMELTRKDDPLDQVQVTAYGTTSKRLNTGNITTITKDEIARNPVSNVLQVLQYRVPGMFVTQQTGIPGGRFNVEIRGKSTFGEQSPLYIIDGVSYPAGSPLPFISPVITNRGDSKGLQGGNALNFIDPSIIESVEVLKDADATAIYGSRGAYGVILITTKKGKVGDPVLNVSINQSISVRGSSPRMLNLEEYLELRREALANSNITPGPTDFDLNGTWPLDRYTNWSKEFSGLYSPAFRGNVSYSGGTGNISYLIRGHYNEQKTTQKDKGSLINTGMAFNINTHSNNRRLAVIFSGNYSSSINDMKPWDFALGDLNKLAPNAPSLFLPDGNLNWETGENYAKPLELIFKRVENTLISNLKFEYRPAAGLVLSTNVGYNTIIGRELRAEPTKFFNPNGGLSPSSQSNSALLNYTSRTITVEPNVSYSTRLGAKGSLTVTSGATLQDVLNNSNTISGTDFISDAMLHNPTFAKQANIRTEYTQFPDKYAGFFGVARYNWGNKYVLNLNGRYDGSTKFGPGNRWGLFGSVGGLWIFTEEKWFKNAIGFLSFGKLRGSYGTTGGDGISNYLYLPRYSGINNSYQGNFGLNPSSLSNPDLQWEETNKAEVALELGFFKDRILVSGSYFKNDTRNQLTAQPLSTVTGFATYLVNSPAHIRNTGVELVLSSRNIRNKNFSWNTNFVFTIPRNKLVSFPNLSHEAFATENQRVGESVNGKLLYKYAGVNPQTGNYNFYKDGVQGEYLFIFSPVQLEYNKDRTEFVDLNPKYFGSMNNNFQYKNLSFGFTAGIVNRMGPNYLGQQFLLGGFANYNTTELFLDRWRKPGDITDVPRATEGILALLLQNNFVTSTGAYSKANYIRISNVNFAYNFSGKTLKRAGIKALSVVLQGQNLFTISKYKDLDPENLGAGTAPIRTFSAGINCTL